jgi:hypothetical protein
MCVRMCMCARQGDLSLFSLSLDQLWHAPPTSYIHIRHRGPLPQREPPSIFKPLHTLPLSLFRVFDISHKRLPYSPSGRYFSSFLPLLLLLLFLLLFLFQGKATPEPHHIYLPIYPPLSLSSSFPASNLILLYPHTLSHSLYLSISTRLSLTHTHTLRFAATTRPYSRCHRRIQQSLSHCSPSSEAQKHNNIPFPGWLPRDASALPSRPPASQSSTSAPSPNKPKITLLVIAEIQFQPPFTLPFRSSPPSTGRTPT